MTDGSETGQLGRRRNPFVAVGEWVALADISSRAKELYALLLAHVNQSRADGIAWPSRGTLAALLRYSRPNKVDPLLTELEALGAIEVKRDRRRPDGSTTANLYLVHEVPPDGYGGPESLAGWYAARRQHAKRGAGATATHPEEEVSPRGGGPKRGLGVGPNPDPGVGPKRGPQEPPVVELPEAEPPPPQPPSEPADEPDAQAPAEGEGERSNEDQDPDADDRAHDLLRAAPWPAGYRPSAGQRAELVTLTRRALDRGHPESDVQAALDRPLDGANNPGAVMLSRLRPLAEQDPDPRQAEHASKDAMARVPHAFKQGRSAGYCATCGRHEINSTAHPKSQVYRNPVDQDEYDDWSDPAREARLQQAWADLSTASAG
jgi:hypothetical protein